ncbi:MAG: hypothetical protein WD711_00520 [Dongiaceae bacterium]
MATVVVLASCTAALVHNGHETNVRRMTGNVLRRFVDPKPFEMLAE